MLDVYLYNPDSPMGDFLPKGLELIRDPDAVFMETKLAADSTDAKLVEVIDGGKLVDGQTFVDRFGVTLYTSNLSTGCKAALLVNNTDNVVDLRECGINAISAIFSFCHKGHVTLSLPGLDLTDFSEGAEVAINIEGHVFTKVRDAYRGLEDGPL